MQDQEQVQIRDICKELKRALGIVKEYVGTVFALTITSTKPLNPEKLD